MLNRLLRTTIKSTRTVRSANVLFNENSQFRNKHFYLVQWPNNSFSCRLKQEDESTEDDYMNTILRYAEMQHNSINNVKEKTPQPLSFSISSQQMKDLSGRLNLTDVETSYAQISSLNVQSNKITLVDKSVNYNTKDKLPAENKPVIVQPVQAQKQETVVRKAKRGARNTKATESVVVEIVTAKKEGEPQEE
jgi:hypothetical protein